MSRYVPGPGGEVLGPQGLRCRAGAGGASEWCVRPAVASGMEVTLAGSWMRIGRLGRVRAVWMGVAVAAAGWFACSRHTA